MTFADTYLLRTNQANFDRVASAVDALLLNSAGASSATLISTSSATLVDYTGASAAITLNSGENVFVFAEVMFSCGNGSNATASFRLMRDSTPIGFQKNWIGQGVGTTGGDKQSIFIFAIDGTTVGAHTYKLQWKVDSGTVYGTNMILEAHAIQVGA